MVAPAAGTAARRTPAWDVAAGTADPEIPTLTIEDLGILRSVDYSPGRGVVVTITPTYSGCPAMREIAADVQARLSRAGFERVTVETQLAPPWSTDWITEEGHRKLAAVGIAPPGTGTRARRPRPADAWPAPRPGCLPALRLARHPADGPVQRHGLQVAAPLQRVRRALRSSEAHMTQTPISPGAGRVTPASRRSRDFHRLTVKRVERLTDDSAAITLAVPGDLADVFAFAAGQSLTVRRGDERRSYSICAPGPDFRSDPRIGVREVAGGAVSGWLVRSVKAGDILEVQAPSGTFTPDLTVPGRHVLIAAGSGITPMMSIAASVLAADDKSTVTLLYGNRRSDTVMFADEVADLKDAYPARMQIVHVLSREPQEVELHSGRLDAGRLTALLPATVDVAPSTTGGCAAPSPWSPTPSRCCAGLAWTPPASTASCSGSATSCRPRRPTTTPRSGRAPA